MDLQWKNLLQILNNCDQQIFQDSQEPKNFGIKTLWPSLGTNKKWGLLRFSSMDQIIASWQKHRVCVHPFGFTSRCINLELHIGLKLKKNRVISQAKVKYSHAFYGGYNVSNCAAIEDAVHEGVCLFFFFLGCFFIFQIVFQLLVDL